VKTVYRRRLEKLGQEEGEQAAAALAAELIQEWTTESEPWEAAAHLALDDIIEPSQTRAVIATAIELTWGGRAERVSGRWR
jgi:methylmalonyl-CoA decarboxylase subunit alpha